MPRDPIDRPERLHTEKCPHCGLWYNAEFAHDCEVLKRKKWEEARQRTRTSEKHWKEIREYRERLIKDLKHSDPAAAKRVEKAMKDEKHVIDVIMEKCDFRADYELIGVSCDIGHGCRLEVGVMPSEKTFGLQINHCEF